MTGTYLHDANAESLQHFLSSHVPAVNALGLQVSSYDGQRLVVKAPLEKNINDKGTAFGGSLYNVCVMASWGMTSMIAFENELRGDIVVAKGEIEYFLPLQSDLIASVQRPSKTDIEHFVASFQRKGKAVLRQSALVLNQQGDTCVAFTGKFALVSGQ